MPRPRHPAIRTEELRRLMGVARLTAAQLAAKATTPEVPITESAVRSWWGGYYGPSPDKRRALEIALRVAVGHLEAGAGEAIEHRGPPNRRRRSA